MLNGSYRMAWFRRHLKDHQAPNPPLLLQGHQLPHLILDQAAQGSIQPGLEHLKGWGIHNLSGQPVPAPHHSHSKVLPPAIQPKSSLLQLKNISSCPVVICPFKELALLLFIGSLLGTVRLQ